MLLDQDTHSSNGLTPLISGILSDAQKLIEQQLSLFQSELKNDLGNTKDAAISLSLGVAVSQLAGFFLFMMTAHFIAWMWPEVPLFAAYGIVGVLLAIGAGILLIVAKTKFDSFKRHAGKSLVGLRENVQWITKT